MSGSDNTVISADRPSRKTRHLRLLRAQFSSPQHGTHDMLIRNVSSRGLGAATRGRSPLKDERVAIHLPFGTQISGVVRWVAGRSFGIEFDENFDLEACAQIFERWNESMQFSKSWQVGQQYRIKEPVPRPKGALRRV
jgi:hypothetical protein